MGSVEKEESMIPYCPSSTNWLLGDGSLEGSITFETSTSIAAAEGAESIPVGVLLRTPPDSRPCEITIFFREKHEIHSIYVRSTARVYEIYYASDEKVNSNEYLCTVRCGAALQKVTANACEGALAECKVPNDVNAVPPMSDGNNTVEDGWVEVEVHDSIVQDNRRFSLSNQSETNILSPMTQIHYEATAEISDASPCMSVTLRLLSHQIKTSVHVEEIYIYADPLEDADPEPPVNNVGAGSLLSMLVPGLIQLSKSGNSRLQDGLSDVLGGSVHGSCPDMSGITKVEASSVACKVGIGLDQQHREVKLEHSLMASRDKVTNTDHVSRPKIDANNLAHGCVQNVLDKPDEKQNAQTKPEGPLRSTEEEKVLDQSQKDISDESNTAHTRLEKILDDLVSRVGRIEMFCSSFQQNIIKPLTGIDTRLQRMEEQLDAITKRPPSSEIQPSSRIPSPESSGHECDSENKGCISSLVVMESVCNEKEALVDKLVVSLPESQKGSGLLVKVPEFPYGDDDDVEPSNHGDDFVGLAPKEYPIKEKCLPIDSALASALSAFLASTSDKFSVHNQDLMDVPNEQKKCAGHLLDSTGVALPSVAANNLFLESNLGNCEVMNEDQDELCLGSISYPDDLMYIDNSLNEFVMFREAERQGNCLVESLLADDDSSAEVDINEPKGMIIRAPEFANIDNIIDCGESFDPHAIFFPGTHLHMPEPGTTPPLALFLSSSSDSSTECIPNPHDVLPTAGNNFLLSTVQAHGGSDDVVTISHERSAKTEADSSLLGFFLPRGVSELENVDSYRGMEVHGGETSSFMYHVNIMEDVNRVLKCDGLHCNWMSRGSAITQNLLPCSGFHSDRSSILVQDEQSWVCDCKLQNASPKKPMSNMLGRFEAADSCTTSSSDGIFLNSKLHLECFDSKSMAVGAFSVIGEDSEQTADKSGSSESTAQFQSIGISQMDPIVEHVWDFSPGREAFISNVNFCTEKYLRSWLPLEELLSESYAKKKSLDQVEVVFTSVPDQEDSASNSKLCVDGDLSSGPLLQKDDDLAENNDYNNDIETGQQCSSHPAKGLSQTVSTLLDVEDKIVPSKDSGMMNAAMSEYPASSGSGQLFSSLI